MLSWNDEHAIWLDEQAFADQRDRHSRVTGKDFMKEGGRLPEVIDDDDGHAEICWQMP